MAKISIIRGDDHTFTMTFTDDAGDPIDLTDVQVDFTVKRQSEINAPTDADVILKKTVTNVGDPTLGITEIVLTNQDTDIFPGSYFYDIQIQNVDGTIQSIEKDIFEVIQDVTKQPQLSS